MYVTRGTPGRRHLAAGSIVPRFLKFSLRLASAAGRYGIVPPSTTPRPAGTPVDAACGSILAAAGLIACQTPCGSGCPSAVRGTMYLVCPCSLLGSTSRGNATSINITPHKANTATANQRLTNVLIRAPPLLATLTQTEVGYRGG